MAITYESVDLGYADAVGYAAAVLDVKIPGWAARINVHELDMSSNTHCILGQLYAPTLLQRLWRHQTHSGYVRGFMTLEPERNGINPNVFALYRTRHHWLREIAIRLTEKDSPCATSSAGSEPSTSAKLPVPAAALR